jgi:uncharacterized protein (DUF58 family)
MFSRGGNQVGALLYDNGAVRTVPPGTGRRHVLRVAAELSRAGPGGAHGHANGGRRGKRGRANGRHRGTTDLAAMLDAVAKLARRRSLIIVISDFIGDGDWERSLLRLGPRHEVMALRVVDTADDELPDAGLVVVEDAETGEQLVVDSGDPLLRARFRAAAGERDASLAAGMRRAGVPVHRIDTTADLATALVDVVASTKRRRP